MQMTTTATIIRSVCVCGRYVLVAAAISGTALPCDCQLAKVKGGGGGGGGGDDDDDDHHQQQYYKCKPSAANVCTPTNRPTNQPTIPTTKGT